MPYIYSTCTASTAYAVYAKTDDKALPLIEKKILINGGANVSNKHFVTPLGVATLVSDEELELLKKDYHFNEHLKLGYLKIEAASKPIETVVKDMKPKDASAPKTPDDPEYKQGNLKVADSSKGERNKGK